mmetsp:Transcript_19818/g.38843  ORF Transcript_19818/g.38843 Transcript_19818/m.38843 type:complete len:203 (-) Transcript_19818:618-1226(-)
MDTHKHRLPLDSEADEVLHILGLGSRKEHGLALLREQANNLLHIILKTNLKDTVSLINNEAQQVLKDKSLGIAEVIQETTRGADEQVYTALETISFCTAVGTSNNNAGGLGVVLADLKHNTVDLESEFTGGGDDHYTCAVACLETHAGKELYSGDEERQCLTGARFGGTDEIAALEQGWDSLVLNLGQALKATVLEAFLCLL